MAERWDNTWEVDTLDIINGHYKEALDALPLEDMPSLAPRLLDAGVCFGFADPVTNIIANTLSSCESELELNGAKNRKRKRKMNASGDAISREAVLSKIITCDGPSSPPEARTVAERSIEGLVSFLVSYFRHLTRGDALRYLSLARADLLVAVNLVQKDRCCRRKDQLQICSPTVKTALRCAARSARQPNFDGFLAGSFALVSHINMITQTLSAEGCCRRLTVQDISMLSGLLANPVKLKKSDNPMKLVPKRLHDPEIRIENVPGQELTKSLRGVLMDRVHKHYLKAMSRFPMKDLQTHHHRGLLKAGYCFGPFHPVSNIIVNTIWYDTAFPPSKEFHVDMISTLSVVEARSVNGLIAFVRACFPPISEHKAMIYLLKSNLDVHKAIQLAKSEGCDVSVCDDNGGYKAAAKAASHPNPDAYCEFVLQTLSVVGSTVRSLLQASRMLSPGEILRLSTLLSSSNVESVEPTIQLTKDGLERITKCKEDFLTQQSFVHRKVEAALQNYEHSKGCNYNLGAICGVNDRVGMETGFCCDTKYPYTHANFWASQDNGIVTLFFAEFANDESSDYEPRCYPMSGLSTKVRCCYCEREGIRIVHPTEICWEGVSAFEEIACEEHYLTNEDIVSEWRRKDSGVVGVCEQDYMYLEPQDSEIILTANRSAAECKADIIDTLRRLLTSHAA